MNGRSSSGVTVTGVYSNTIGGGKLNEARHIFYPVSILLVLILTMLYHLDESNIFLNLFFTPKTLGSNDPFLDWR
jgi:hypothetical protein